MFTILHTSKFDQHQYIFEAGFRLRKRVFHDALGWDVEIHRDREVDAYDALAPAWLVWCSPDRRVLYGMVRLMPTDGPTLLHDVFHESCAGASLRAYDVWEGTRMCLDEEAIARDFPQMTMVRAFNCLLLALCEVAVAAGIRTLVSNCMPRTSLLYRRAGLDPRVVGKAHGFDEEPVLCVRFDIAPGVLFQMRRRIGVHLPLLNTDAVLAAARLLEYPVKRAAV